MNAHFLEPLDVLFLRGNRLFGDAGSYGESMVPPWPSAVAGAIRSAILARDGIDPAAFGTGEIEHVTWARRAGPATSRSPTSSLPGAAKAARGGWNASTGSRPTWSRPGAMPAGSNCTESHPIPRLWHR